MSTGDDFVKAQARVKQLSKAPATDQLLELYGLYKQASFGDVTGAKPEALDFKARAKYNAWAARKGTSRDDAMAAYVALVDKLTRQYG